MHIEGRYGFLIVLDWQTTETCVLPDRHPRRADFFIQMGGIGWMMSDRERKGLAIIETAAPDVYTARGSQVRRIAKNSRDRWAAAYSRPASSVRSGSGDGSGFGRD